VKNARSKGSVPRRALVTGASGFVGGHLARRLVREGWDVHCVLRSSRKRGLLAGWEKQVEFHLHDGSTDGLCAIAKSAAPDVVFHLASLFVAEHRTDDVSVLVDSTVRFAAQLAEAMTGAGATRLVNTGSAWEHFRGDEPANLYAATKQAAQAVFRFYAASTPFRVVTLTLFDTYGPEDPRPKLLPMLFRAAGSSQRIALSPGRQMLDLVHIDDVTSAYLAAADRLLRRTTTRRAPEEFAVSSGRAWTLRQIVAFVSKAAGQTIKVDWGARPYRAREVMKPWNSGRTLPGWRTTIELSEGLRRLSG
jgi:nucleoside-diphosphate-sugar epimerase